MPRFKDGSKIIQSRLAVVERQPKKTIAFVVLSIVLLGLSFYIGKEVGVFEARIFREKVSELETALDSLAESHEVIENELTVTILQLEIQEKMISDLKNREKSTKADASAVETTTNDADQKQHSNVLKKNLPKKKMDRVAVKVNL